MGTYEITSKSSYPNLISYVLHQYYIWYPHQPTRLVTSQTLTIDLKGYSCKNLIEYMKWSSAKILSSISSYSSAKILVSISAEGMLDKILVEEFLSNNIANQDQSRVIVSDQNRLLRASSYKICDILLVKVHGYLGCEIGSMCIFCRVGHRWIDI